MSVECIINGYFSKVYFGLFVSGSICVQKHDSYMVTCTLSEWNDNTEREEYMANLSCWLWISIWPLRVSCSLVIWHYWCDRNGKELHPRKEMCHHREQNVTIFILNDLSQNAIWFLFFILSMVASHERFWFLLKTNQCLR